MPTRNTNLKGRIRFDAYVDCGKCDKAMTGLSALHPDFDLQDAGWRRTRNWGWICAECAATLGSPPIASRDTRKEPNDA